MFQPAPVTISTH